MAPKVLNSQEKSSVFDHGSAEAPPPLRSYLCLTVLACFCPAHPVNIVGLVYCLMSRRSYYQGDYEGSRRLGRNALCVSVASIIIGLLIIAITCIVHFTRMEY
ncbi:hypothetical protein OJAV_G00044030 [Oryzias javanicus]|uniref:Transmembrane protein 233 n=1 Tax=Oryzias javanicus TaxID=123683 RepID=A0A3S2PDQ6_ORYJA|nr:hypothetical protein OJAV_G00044030 [Oryzias javanicus]